MVGAGPANRILASLERGEYESLAGTLEERSLSSGEVLQEQDAPGERVWFPVGAVVLLEFSTHDGGPLGAGLVGNEGATGLFAIIPGMASPWREEVVLAGRALTADAARIGERMFDYPGLRSSLMRYHWQLTSIVHRSGVCHRLHSPESRLARWLLALDDRAATSSQPLPLSPLSALTGAGPASLAEIAAPLVDGGSVGQEEDGLRVLDHALLERTACDCYAHCRSLFA
jgi:CRP-like cAMP-binding protein